MSQFTNEPTKDEDLSIFQSVGIDIKGIEGKQTDLSQQTPMVGPPPPPAGESSSGNTSLGSPERDDEAILADIGSMVQGPIAPENPLITRAKANRKSAAEMKAADLQNTIDVPFTDEEKAAPGYGVEIGGGDWGVDAIRVAPGAINDEWAWLTDIDKGGWQEENVVDVLNKNLAKFGLVARESKTGIENKDGLSFNAIEIQYLDPDRDIRDDEPSIWGGGGRFIALTTINTFNDELDTGAGAQIVAAVERYGDPDYLKKQKNRLGPLYDQMMEFAQVNIPEADFEAARKQAEEAILKDIEIYRKGGYLKRIKRAVKSPIYGSDEYLELITKLAENDWTATNTINDFLNSDEGITVINEIANKEREAQIEIGIDRAIDRLSENASNIYGDEEYTRLLLAALADDEYKRITSSKVEEAVIKEQENLFAARDNADAKIEKFLETQDPYDRLDAILAIQDVEAQRSSVMPIVQKYSDSRLPLEIINNEVSGWVQDYTRWDRFTNGFQQLGFGALYAIGELDVATGLVEQEVLDQGFANWTQPIKDAQGRRSKIKEVKVSEMFDSWDNFSNFALNSIVDAAPSITAIAVLKKPGLAGISIAAGGQKGVDIASQRIQATQKIIELNEYLQSEELSDSEKSRVQEEIKEFERIANISESEKLLSMGGAMAAEYLFERFGTFELLKWTRNVGKLVPPKTFKGAAGTILYQGGKGFLQEGGTEGLTELTNNGFDIYNLGEDKNIFENVDHAFVSGGIVGKGMTLTAAPRLIVNGVTAELATKKQQERLQEIQQELEELTNTQGLDFDFPNIRMPESLTPQLGGQALQDRVQELTDEMSDIQNEILNGYTSGKFTPEQLYNIGELNRNIRAIEKDFTVSMLASGGMSASQKEAIKRSFEEKINNAVNERNAYLSELEISGAENSFDFEATTGYQIYSSDMANGSLRGILEEFTKLSPEARQELLDEVAAENAGQTLSEEELEDLAREKFVDNKYAERIARGKENALKYAQKYSAEANKEINIISVNDKAAALFELNKLREEGFISQAEFDIASQKVNEGSFEGVNYSKRGPSNADFILVNEEAAIKNKRTGVYAHEVLHSIVANELGQKDAQLAGENLLNWLEQNDKDLFVLVKERIDRSYTERDNAGKRVKDANGEFIKNEAYYEEAMNALSDVLADGAKPSAGLITQARVFINSMLGKKGLSLKDNADTYLFIRDYNNKAHFGKKRNISPSFIRSITPGQDEDQAQARESVSADRARQTLDEIQEEGFTGAEPQLYDVLNGMVGAQLSKYKNKGLQINDMEEAVADVVARMYTEGDVFKFDGRGQLYGFLNGRIAFRIKDAFKSNPVWVEDFTESVAEELSAKEVREIAVEAVETTAAVTEAPTYKNLLDRNVLPSEAVKTLTDKVKRTVRTMKVPMDKVVSKNVTVKPYIAEIKKAMGKQADIDLKKAMGGLKDGQLRKYLLNNKRAILENMTTTYLMTAMPNAVQKKVDGVWTSNWQGKKIDRETVSTDNAGRTSGAELVRRLPNASTRLSDADYLSNFFNEDGSLIRGRKESLAKAMAEEISFDIINKELKNPNSEIREAFEQRQGELNVVLTEAYSQEVARDIERGNAKYSVSEDTMRSAEFQAELAKLVRAASKARGGVDSVIDEDGAVNEEYAKKLKLTDEWAKDIVELVREAEDAGLLMNADGITFMKGIKESNIIPEGIKIKKGLTNKNATKAELDKYRDNMRRVGARLGKDVMSVWGIEGLGFHYRILDPAKSKKGKPGETGAYYKDAQAIQNNTAPSEGIPDGLDLGQVQLMNKSFSLFKEVARILNPLKRGAAKLDSKQAKLDAYNNSELPGKIEKASHHNKLLAKHIAKTLISMVRDGSLDGDAYLQMLQAQTQLSGGFRALTGLQFLTFKDGRLGNIKGEHLVDNSTTMLKLAEMPFDNLTDAEIDAKLDEVFEEHDQWIENKSTLNFVDAFGRNNQSGIGRLLTLPKAQLNDVYHVSGVPASEFLESHAKVKELKENFNKSIDKAKAVEAKDDLVPSARMSQSNPKAVFMVGGPGAGKTNVGKGLKLGRRGFKVINQDLALEPMKEEAGLPANEQQYTKEQRSMRAKLGAKARKAAEEKMSKYMNNRESMVVDGTGASYNATMKKINALRDAGYEVSVVFANTSKAEAIARNKARKERALPDFVVERTWDAVQESAELYKQEFGENFYELNTNKLQLGEELPQSFLNKLYNDLEVSNARMSQTLSQEFNKIIENSTGIKSYKVFSKVQAEIRGAKKGRFKFFVPPGADDFRGLVHYAFAGKGKQGDADMAWLEEKLMNPYFKGVEAINRVRQQIKRDYKATIKLFKPQYKMLDKKIGDSGFTYDQAVRVYLWDRQGTPVPGISKRDKKILLDAIKQNPELAAFADALLVVARRDAWMEPGEYWQAQTVLSDLNSMTEKIGRKKFLQEFIENAEAIFTEDNLNKIEAIKGRAHREAIEDALYSMKNGTNRVSGTNATVNKFINWINGSTGAIMFFNRRSALLQMLSTTNFINWSDNNPLKAGAAFANQKQYWSDWAMIFNSDKLKERRSGLKTDVSESELAQAANRSKGDPRAVLAWLLKQGFLPTQIADSFAIATGGATFYRNRVNSYLKQGLSKERAEEKAWLDFTKISDEAQQSSDPALVSQQQRSVLGRLVFAFANTPMQYTRLMKKAALDLKNGRGDWKTNVSKIAYYGFVQNFIFSALQSALFALIPGFDDDDEEKDADKEEAKVVRVLDSMLDTILRGSGLYGAAISTIKNVVDEFVKQDEKGFLADHAYTVIAATSISPPINSKLRKIYSAIQTYKFEKDELEARPFDVATDGRPNFGPGWSITGSLVSGALNVPLDRVIDELNSVGEAMDARNSAWQRIALALGWKTWDVGAVDEEGQAIKEEGKARRKQEGIQKAKETRRQNKAKKSEDFANDIIRGDEGTAPPPPDAVLDALNRK